MKFVKMEMKYQGDALQKTKLQPKGRMFSYSGMNMSNLSKNASMKDESMRLMYNRYLRAGSPSVAGLLEIELEVLVALQDVE